MLTHLLQHSVQCRLLASGPPLQLASRSAGHFSACLLSSTASHRAHKLQFRERSPRCGLTAWHACAQIANSWGQSVDKGSYAERKAFVRDHLDLVLDSAERPFGGHK